MKYKKNMFKKFKWIIDILLPIFKLMPNFLLKIIWALFDNHDGYFSLGVRYLIIKSKARQCGDNLYIGKRVIIKNLNNISFGNNVSIHTLCYVDALGEITIGNDVSIAHNVSLISFEHGWSDENIAIKYNDVIKKPILINDDVWIGCGARILSGTVIGTRVIVGAGSVTKGQLDRGSIYLGVPARFAKKI